MREVFFMFVFSLNGRSVKLAGLCAFACVAIAATVFLLPEKEMTGTAYVSSVTNEVINFGGIKTEEDRKEFISSFGIEVSETAVEELETMVPKKFDAVYDEYNSIQLAQGLDLSKFKGKKIKRYTYKMLNYPKDEKGIPENVYLNLIQYKDRVIAGDIASSEGGGFVRTFCDFSSIKS
jgi:hypothetical protein